LKNLICFGLFTIAITICSRAIAQEAPVIINPQTGAVVNLTHAYWDANVDIADRRMQCDYFSFDAETGVFEKVSRGGPTLFDHRALLKEISPINFVDFDTSSFFRILPLWSVTDGVYLGPAPLAVSEFVEIVAFNASIDNAVRVWLQDESVPAYIVCYDLDGGTLLPTGAVGSGNTQLVELPDFTFDFPDFYENVPEIINLETGETVQIVRGRWSYNKDVALNSASCDHWAFSGIRYVRLIDVGFIEDYFPYNGGELVETGFQGAFDRNRSIGGRPISSFELPGAQGLEERYMEITDNGYRFWSASGIYFGCDLQPIGFDSNQEVKPFGPTEFLPLLADETLLISNENTSPVITDNCDYSDADDFDGYGFDPVTMLSCPPLDSENSDNDTTDSANNIQDTGTTENANVMQANPIPVDNAPDDSTVSSEDNTSVQNTNDVQTNADTSDSSFNDSAGNANDATRPESENTAEDVAAVSNNQSDSTEADLFTSDQTASPSSGGGSFWLPVLMFVLAFRRPMRSLQKQY